MAELEMISGEKEEERINFTGVAYSGIPIPRHHMLENLSIDLASMSFKETVPVFFNHSADKVTGFGKLKIENNQLVVEGHISSSTPEGKRILSLSKEGMPWELSVGTDPEYLEAYNENTVMNVNGSQVKGPGVIFRNTRVLEVSVVPVGADSNTATQFFSKDLKVNNEKKDIDMSNEKVLKVFSLTKDADLDSKGFEVIDAYTEEIIEIPEELESKFACGCGDKQQSVSSMKTELESLREELKGYKDKEKKGKRKNRFERVETTFSALKMPMDEALFSTMFELLDEEDFEKAITKFEASIPAEVTNNKDHKELTEKSSKSGKVKEPKVMSVQEIDEAAKKYMSEQGETDYIKAIKKVSL